MVADEILTVGLNNDYMKLPTLEMPKEKKLRLLFHGVRPARQNYSTNPAAMSLATRGHELINCSYFRSGLFFGKKTIGKTTKKQKTEQNTKLRNMVRKHDQ